MNKVLATDLDGTLQLFEGRLAPSETALLERMGKAGVLRILLTGRNYYSLCSVIPQRAPLDYVCYSSGAGILHWKSRKVLRQSCLNDSCAVKLEKLLSRDGYSFFCQYPLPSNHHFSFHRGKEIPRDVQRRLNRYENYRKDQWPHSCSQFLVILSDECQRDVLSDSISRELPQLSQIYATSPMDHRTPWLEIFPPGVSKSGALKFLCGELNLSREHFVALGNDWNDLDMLQWAEEAWLVPGTVKALHGRIPLTGEAPSPLHFVSDQILGDL